MAITNSFVVLGVILAFAILPRGATAQCPLGWKNYRNSKCYLFSRQRATWNQARKICTSYEADLVKIKTQEENNFLTRSRRGIWWIGLFLDPRISAGNRFIWTDRSPLTEMTNWGWGEPSSRAGRDACVEMHFWDGTWHEYPCKAKFRFICQKAANKCEIDNGGCPQKCTRSEGKAVCSCVEGYASFDNGKMCVALEEILTAGRVWEKKCLRSSPEGSCQCGPGYIKTQTARTWSCVDVDECQQNNGGCQHTCVNTAGSYKCVCNDGFVASKSGKTCTEAILIGGEGIQRCTYVEGVVGCVCARGYEEKRLGPTLSFCVKSRIFESTPSPTETTKTMDWNENTPAAGTDSLSTDESTPPTETIKTMDWNENTNAAGTDSPSTHESTPSPTETTKTVDWNENTTVATTDSLITETARAAFLAPKTSITNASKIVPEAAKKPSVVGKIKQPSTTTVRTESQRQSTTSDRVDCSAPYLKENSLFLRAILVLLVAVFFLGLLSFLYLVFSFSRLWRAWNQGYELTNNASETSEFMLTNPSKTVPDSIVNPLYEAFVKEPSSSAEQEKKIEQ